MKIAIVVERTETGFSGYAPELPGVASTGATIEQLRTNMREALSLHLDGLAEDGEPLEDDTQQVCDVYLEDMPVPAQHRA